MNYLPIPGLGVPHTVLHYADYKVCSIPQRKRIKPTQKPIIIRHGPVSGQTVSMQAKKGRSEK